MKVCVFSTGGSAAPWDVGAARAAAEKKRARMVDVDFIFGGV